MEIELLSDVIYEFRNGRRYHYSSRRTPQHHRISSPDWWYAWSDKVKEYPAMVKYQTYYDNEPKMHYIGEIGSGRRTEGAQILLWRYAEDNEEASWFRSAFEDDTGKLLMIERRSLEYVANNDIEFSNWIKRCPSAERAIPEIYKEEEPEVPCRNGCRRSYCYCDEPLSYDVNEHSMTVDIEKGGKTLRLSLNEANELASFLLSAKDKIKEAKINSLKAQQDELAKQLDEINKL